MFSEFHVLKEFAPKVQSLDPLKTDVFIQNVPKLNEEKDIKGLLNMLQNILPVESIVHSWSTEEAAAAIRDIGILLGSIKRHELEPCAHVDNLEKVLMLLGEKTDFPPRDNVIHYTYWNPRGIRQRQYTNFLEEKDLIESVRMAYPNLYDSLAALLQVSQLNISDSEFEVHSTICLSKLKDMVAIIKNVKKTVDPLVFARSIRPYFESITVNGELIKGPGAVELPLFLVDHFLWSSDANDNDISNFQETYLPGLPAFLKELYFKQKGQPPLTKIVSRQLSVLPKNTIDENKAFKFIQEVLDTLIQFRAPHYYLAKSAYDTKDKGHDFAQGSGGYTTNILKHIVQKNIDAKNQFCKSLNENINETI